jgi:hypothetical protein
MQIVSLTNSQSVSIKHVLVMKLAVITPTSIRIRISKKDRQHNGQKKKYKMINNDLQNIHIKQKTE